MLTRPDRRQGPDWAAKIHFAVAPVYYHNYLLGELIASQLGAAVGMDALNGTDPRCYVERGELGEFLRHRVFDYGASLPWQTLLDRATGSPLSPEPFLEEFVPLPDSD